MVALDKWINRVRNGDLGIVPLPPRSNNKLLIAQVFVDMMFCYHEGRVLDFDFLDNAKLPDDDELFITLNLTGMIAYPDSYIENLEKMICGNPDYHTELRYIMVNDGIVKLADKPIKITPFKIGFK